MIDLFIYPHPPLHRHDIPKVTDWLTVVNSFLYLQYLAPLLALSGVVGWKDAWLDGSLTDKKTSRSFSIRQSVFLRVKQDSTTLREHRKDSSIGKQDSTTLKHRKDLALSLEQEGEGWWEEMGQAQRLRTWKRVWEAPRSVEDVDYLWPKTSQYKLRKTAPIAGDTNTQQQFNKAPNEKRVSHSKK